MRNIAAIVGTAYLKQGTYFSVFSHVFLSVL